jgi:hypothetical protein
MNQGGESSALLPRDRGGKMKFRKTINFGFIVGIILLNGLVGKTSEAQPPKVPMAGPFSETQSKGACRKDPSIICTEEQTKGFEGLQCAHSAEAKPIWSELVTLRLEMRYAVSDPQVQSQVLLDKQGRISALQARLENLRFSYLIKARSIFTKEQLERFPPDCPLKMRTGYGMRRSFERRPRKGIRP